MANTNRAEVRNAIHSRIRRKVIKTAVGDLSQPEPHLRSGDRRSSGQNTCFRIDDREGFRGNSGGNLDAARRVGTTIAERAIAKGIEQVVFDRGGYLYHGRIKALTDAARAAGLNKNEVVAAEANGESRKPPAESPRKRRPRRRKGNRSLNRVLPIR